MNIGTDIGKAKRLLEHGELVAIPTETVYGLAANGLDAKAVVKIYEAKNRPSFNPLILHTASLDHIKALVRLIPPKAFILARHFWPGPLTLILPKKDIVPDVVTAGLDTVGVRVPAHPMTLKLLKLIDFPLAAPSANRFGYVSPTLPEHVADQLGDKVAYILDGGRCSVGVESTIIKVVDNEVNVLRLGGIELERIEEIVGRVKRITPDHTSSPESPGMLTAHYAPGKKLILGKISKNLGRYDKSKVGIIAYTSGYNGIDSDRQKVLSPTGDLKEAARNLFDALKQLDDSNVDIILAEYVPDIGLGRAINDRLKRAAAKD